MAYNRQERVLSAGKQSIPLIRKGKPQPAEGFHGDLAFAELDGIGIVQYIKIENNWRRVVNHNITTQAELSATPIPEIEENSQDTSSFIKKDGSRDFTGNQSHGGHNIENVNNLDVGGVTNLDETRINTNDGDFQILGDENNIAINLNASRGQQDVSITTGDGVLEFSAFNYGSSNPNDTLLITSSGESKYNFGEDVTITMQPLSSFNWQSNSLIGTYKVSTGLISYNDNYQLSGSFDVLSACNGIQMSGINLTADTNTVSGSLNSIKIKSINSNFEPYNPKEGFETVQLDWGVDVHSDFGVRLFSDASSLSQTASDISIGASGRINIGASSLALNLSQNPYSATRTKLHGLFEFTRLYKTMDNRQIYTDIGYNTSLQNNLDYSSTDQENVEIEYWHEYPKWDAIDTSRLMRAHTHRACGRSGWSSAEESVPHGGKLYIVLNRSTNGITVPDGTTDGNGNASTTTYNKSEGNGTDFGEPGTVWLVTVFFHNSANTKQGFNAGYVVNTKGVTATADALTPERAGFGYTTQYYTDAGAQGKISYDYDSANLEGSGIYWENDMNDGDMYVYASALRIQSGINFWNTFGNS